MKKNRMMRLASLLLVCVLLTTSVISGTYAKYVTADTGSDQARVAVWGVEIVEKFNDLFKPSYTTDKPWTPVGDEPADDGFTVWSVYGGDLVAPGTKGALTDFAVTGRPEVDVVVTYDNVNLDLSNWLLDTNANGNLEAGVDPEYCPLIFTVNGTEYYIDGTAIKTIAELETAVENAIVASKAYYNAGTDLATVVNTDLAVSWEWQFDQATAGAAWKNACVQTDAKDTLLGDQAAKLQYAEISLEITCTITQVD